MCETSKELSTFDLWNRLAKMSNEELGSACLELSDSYFQQRQFVSSLTMAHSAQDSFLRIDDVDGVIEAKISIAHSYKSLHQDKEAVLVMEEAIEMLNSRVCSYEWECRRTLADWFYDLRDLESALKQVELCLQNHLYESDNINAGSNYITLAYLVCEMGNCRKSLEYLEKSRKLYQLEKQVESVALVDMYIAGCHNHLKDGTSAYESALKALTIFEVAQNEGKKAIAYTQYARALINQSRYTEALPWLDCAHDLIAEIKPVNFYAIFQIQNHKIRALRGLGRDSDVANLEHCNNVINETLLLFATK